MGSVQCWCSLGLAWGREGGTIQSTKASIRERYHAAERHGSIAFMYTVATASPFMVGTKMSSSQFNHMIQYANLGEDNV